MKEVLTLDPRPNSLVERPGTGRSSLSNTPNHRFYPQRGKIVIIATSRIYINAESHAIKFVLNWHKSKHCHDRQMKQWQQ